MRLPPKKYKWALFLVLWSIIYNNSSICNIFSSTMRYIVIWDGKHCVSSADVYVALCEPSSFITHWITPYLFVLWMLYKMLIFQVLAQFFVYYRIYTMFCDIEMCVVFALVLRFHIIIWMSNRILLWFSFLWFQWNGVCCLIVFVWHLWHPWRWSHL